MAHKCEAVIDLNSIKDNYKIACGLAPDSKSIAVIKADAYGHGAVQVTKALEGIAPAFAVAIIEEAIELRNAGIKEMILVMEGVDGAEDLKYAAKNDLSVVVHNESQLLNLENVTLSNPVNVWLKVDTGMHRLGIDPGKVDDALTRLRASKNCQSSIVVCTHLASSENTNSNMTSKQINLFDLSVNDLNVIESIANSGAILASPDSHRDWNRPGYLIYGYTPFEDDREKNYGLKPSMTLQSEIIALRQVLAGESVGYGGKWTATDETIIATVAIGYADGYPRHAKNGTPTLVNGKIAPVVGAVSMDMITIDVTNIEDTEIGDRVILWGPELSVNQVAKSSNTIGYELITGLTRRVSRRYIK
ncbi:MAG: alanine racemase [Woeseia sp.]|nr:alanine racemase [Woeseia sp.]|tara:strand:- start:2421 stop:3503 length:1083 start_codon:yes stop_codon:yes gene_type:complete